MGLRPEQWSVSFQSRLGRDKWIEPYTESRLEALAGQGVKKLLVMCPAFVADCIETLEEIREEIRESFEAAGGESFTYIPCLNDDEAHIAALAGVIDRNLAGWTD
jgi:ferrochelatase